MDFFAEVRKYILVRRKTHDRASLVEVGTERVQKSELSVLCHNLAELRGRETGTGGKTCFCLEDASFTLPEA